MGGLLRSFHYPDWGVFDYGIHTLYETKDEEVDDIILGGDFPGGWRELPGDWGGIYWHDKLNLDSPYVDLRHLEREKREKYIGEIFETFQQKREVRADNALHWVEDFFGDGLARDIMGPILEKVYRSPSSELNVAAIRLLPFTRVIGFDLAQTLDLMGSALFRSKIAIPNQRELPSQFAAGKKGFYPHKIGMHHYVDWLLRKFQAAGGKIHPETNVEHIRWGKDQIESVELRDKNNNSVQLKDIHALFWAAGLPVFSFHQDAPATSKVAFDKPLNTVVVNMVVSEKPKMHDAQYVYVFDPKFLTFRVANYVNFVGEVDLTPTEGYKLSLEVLAEPHEMGEGFEERIISEICQMGIITSAGNVKFCVTEKLPGGIPKLSNKNVIGLEAVRGSVVESGVRNFKFVGVGAKNNLYFQADILAHAKEEINKFL